MLLILSTFPSEVLKEFSQQMKSSFEMEVGIISVEDIVKRSRLVLHKTDGAMVKTIELVNDKENINFNDVKLVYFAEYPYVITEWLDFQEELDKSYAFQEWTASITAMLNTCDNTKFVNPILTKYDLNSEIEQVKIFQQFGIDTVDMILTNNKNKFLEFYEKSAHSVIFKRVRQGYEFSNLITPKDLVRLEKLQLSPVIFQKTVNSSETEVCIVGKRIFAKEKFFIGGELVFQDVVLPEDLQTKLFAISDYLNSPLLNILFVYDREEEAYKGFSINIYHYFQYYYNLFKNDFIDALKTLLSEEYSI